MHTITSPTGVSVTKELTQKEVEQLQTDKYFNVKEHNFEDFDFSLPEVKGNLRIHRKPPTDCPSCEA